MSGTGCGITKSGTVGGDNGTGIGECDRVSSVSGFSCFYEEGVSIGEESRVDGWNSSGIDEISEFSKGGFFGIGNGYGYSSSIGE